MIKTVIFDLGRVIVPFDYERAYARVEAAGGVKANDIPALLAPTGLFQRIETGTIDPHDFAEQIFQLLNFHVSYAEFCDIWTSIFLPTTLVSDALVEGIGRHHRLVLLSNTNVIHFDMIRANYPILRHFNQFVLSNEVGAMKPSPLIYAKAIEAAQCEPAECFFTDDIAEYIDGARRAGIDAVQFQNERQLRGELDKRRVIYS